MNTETMKTIANNSANQTLLDALESRHDRSAWDKGVTLYACELVEACEGILARDNCKELLLNGASDWSHYSYGGCSLIYDADIAERLCNPSELKRCNGGERNPNGRETWLDCQARALSQACRRVRRAMSYSLADHVA